MEMKQNLNSRSQSLVDLAYARIQKDMLEGEIQPGKKIPIQTLCERYGVSQTPIKQALNRLMMQGIVENIPRKGYKVRRITWNEIDEILEMRLMMELHFLPKTIAGIHNSTVLQQKFEANLSSSLQLAKSFETAEEFLQVYRLDQQFHELFILAGGNRLALQTFQSLHTHRYATFLYGKQPKSKTIEGIKEHQEIYMSLKQENEKEALRQLVEHNKNGREIIYLSLKLAQLL